MWLTYPPAILAASVPVAAVVAEGASGGNFDPTSLIGTALTPALVIVLLILGKLRTEPEVKRLETELARCHAVIIDKDTQLAAMQVTLLDKVVPSLTRATLVLEAVAPALQTETHVRRREGS